MLSNCSKNICGYVKHVFLAFLMNEKGEKNAIRYTECSLVQRYEREKSHDNICIHTYIYLLKMFIYWRNMIHHAEISRSRSREHFQYVASLRRMRGHAWHAYTRAAKSCISSLEGTSSSCCSRMLKISREQTSRACCVAIRACEASNNRGPHECNIRDSAHARNRVTERFPSIALNFRGWHKKSDRKKLSTERLNIYLRNLSVNLLFNK